MSRGAYSSRSDISAGAGAGHDLMQTTTQNMGWNDGRNRSESDDQSGETSSTTSTSSGLFGHDPELVANLVLLVAPPVGPPSSADWLADQGFRTTGRGCRHCDYGIVWFEGHELVCDRCSIVTDMEEKRSRREKRPDPWEVFHQLRANGWYRYRSKKYRRCVGGFSYTYDWVSSDDLDGDLALADVKAVDFYR